MNTGNSFNKDSPYWALRQMADSKQYLAGVVRGTDHLILHGTCSAAQDFARDLALGEWLEAVEVIPSKTHRFSHFIFEAKTYTVEAYTPGMPGSVPDRRGWSQRRLQNTEAYLRHVVSEGLRAVYDAEEHQLLWLSITAEIDRRKEAGQWRQTTQ